MSLIIPANTLASGGYAVDNSCRFATGSSDYMKKSQSGGNREKWTYSTWVKKTLKVANSILINPIGVNIAFNSTHTLYMDVSGVGRIFETNALYRDVSAWYHIVVAFNTTDYSTVSAGQAKVYVNGVEQTFASTTNMSVGFDSGMNQSGVDIGIARDESGDNNYADYYLAETVLIDGQQLTPTDFGEFDADSGIWKPIDVSGLTFGTNGFYLDYKDSANLGNDANGGTDFTEGGLTAIDQTTDTPTNNFCTMNPLDTYNSPTITDGNTIINAGGSDKSLRSTIGISSGKWYWEVNTTANNSANMGIINGEAVLTDGNSLQSVSTNSVIWEGNGGLLFKNGSSVTTEYSGGTATYGFAFDLDNGTLKLSQNGTFYNSGNAVVTGITADTYLPFFAPNGGGSPTEFKANFGNPAYAISSGNTDGNDRGNFEYAVPSGYLSLCTANLSEVLG